MKTDEMVVKTGRDNLQNQVRLALITAFTSLALAGAATAAEPKIPTQLGKEAVSTLQEEPKILSAPPSNAKRVYVTDPGHFNVTSQVFSIDGENNKLLAMTDAGKLPHVMASHDGKFFAVANTLFARIAQGQRNDYIDLVDAQTHDLIAEIDIPEGRFLSATLERMATLSNDDKFLLFQQFSPSPAVGIVDVANKSFVKMVDVPDCYHLFPAANNTFYMHCRDGSLLKVGYDGKGEVKQENTKVFHPEDDYLLNNPSYSAKAGRLVWPSYEGNIYQANLNADGATFAKVFNAFTEEERKQKWRPGGWMTVTYHRPSDTIYLLADQREKWTHKLPSRFVFAFEAATGKRISKIELGHEVDSIGISQDDKPVLYALSAIDRALYLFDPATGKQTGKVDELGKAPVMLTVPEL